MDAVAIINHKGGVGKTTTAVCLSGALVERGHRVLLIDLDPQGSASSWLGRESDGSELLESLVNGVPLKGAVRETESGVDVIPAGRELDRLDRAVSGEPGVDRLLAGALEKLEARWDVVVLDCPPNLSLASVNAVCAARWVVVPVEANFMSLAPLARLFEMISRVRERLGAVVEVAGLVCCRVDRRSKHPKEIQALLEGRFGARMFDTVIRQNVRVAEAASFRQAVGAYAPKCAGAEDYRRLAEEFVRRVGLEESGEGRRAVG